jgi:acetylornithine deacetylase/succinyl-diaminopimelate desuccinylase-like protein
MHAGGHSMKNWEHHLASVRDVHLEQLLDFLRIPSISSLPEHAADVARAGGWVADRLKAAGIENVLVLQTEGHPVVYGEWLRAPHKPTIMVYGHFDVQPVDPLEQWTHPPFDPTVRDNRVYARGASDDKGNMLIPILAAESLLKSENALPVNLKFLFEGQEEIGSPQLAALLAQHRGLLECDMVLSADGGQWAEDRPALIIRRRGLAAVQIEIRAARGDLHSGSYGGTLFNPIHALAGLVASMHRRDGKVAVKGFYKNVRKPSPAEKQLFDAVPFNASEFKSALGIPALFGETGFSTYERIWVRPTLEVNGIGGGFQDEGLKTVIPSRAFAKISCRLVPDQEPDRIIQLLSAHVAEHAPEGVQARVEKLSASAEPYRIAHDHPGNLAAGRVLQSLYGKKPYVTGMGGTIPVCAHFLKILGAHTINFAFGLKDENIHAPDEFFRLSSFDRGLLAYCRMLEELGGRTDF